MKYDYVIVGAGLFGCVFGERIASQLKKRVLIIDKRAHIGGNCHSQNDQETGIEYHTYGTHIFHTSSLKAWNYIKQFTDFNAYHHRVLSRYQGKTYTLPINLDTINAFYEKDFSPLQARALIQREIKREGIGNPRNLEEQALSMVGRPLYEALIEGYSTKHWGVPLTELPARIVKRMPVRFDRGSDYFRRAKWQGIPKDGYTRMFERLLKSKRIDVQLNADYFKQLVRYQAKEKIIYTGPLDRYFNYQFGRLSYRTVRFERRVKNSTNYLGNSVVNCADKDVPYTRIHEPRHLHPERNYKSDKTLLFYETAHEGSEEPFYPVNLSADQALVKKYQALANKEKGVIFGGRLADYKYYDMDQTILAALKCFEKMVSLRR